MTERELNLLAANQQMSNTLYDIELICDRATIHYVEDKDIVDILRAIKELRVSINETALNDQQ